jgi:hypothetical protein
MLPTVRSIMRVMPSGSGFPSLVETEDGRRFVMKLTGAGQGAAGLAIEMIATRLARELGLGVPDVAPIHLPADLPWQTGTDEFYETLRRSAGTNLGIAFVEGARDLTSGDLAGLPPALLDRLAAVDALLQNVDRSPKNPNLLRDPAGRIWAIDFGACLFLGRFRRHGAAMSFALPPNHFLAGRTTTPLILDGLRPALPDILAEVPSSWIQEDRDALARLLGVLLDAYAQGTRRATPP